jgi:Kef-type K+ transport system membrane component KefB
MSDSLLAAAPASDWNIVLTLGMLLVASLVAGSVAHMMRLPRVTAYLLVGLLLGPHSPIPFVQQFVGPLIPEPHLEHLEPIGKLAMALVLLHMGCHFTLVRFRRIARRALRLSAGELTLTFLIVALGLILVGQSWQAAVLFGALAMATAPATTVLVLQESDSEGPVTELTITLTALNNLAAVVGFSALFVIVRHFHNAHPSEPLTSAALALTGRLVGAIVAGIAAGLAASYA